MRTKFYFVAALAATMLASCADDKFVGDNSPNVVQESTEAAINFGFELPNVTRAGDLVGSDAAGVLQNQFIVYGTKHASAEDVAEKLKDNITNHISAFIAKKYN